MQKNDQEKEDKKKEKQRTIPTAPVWDFIRYSVDGVHVQIGLKPPRLSDLD